MDGATTFVLVLAAGFFCLIVYLAILSRRNQKQTAGLEEAVQKPNMVKSEERKPRNIA